MPYFSFSLKKNYPLDLLSNLNIQNVKPNQKYFSKNTILWKNINKTKNSLFLNNHNYEKRHKIENLGKKILFCLPPNIGLGDAVEYALSIKSIVEKNIFQSTGIAFIGPYRIVFEKYFNLTNLYEDLISQDSLDKYDTIFHVTLEIKNLINQKYNRADIEQEILNYFKIDQYRKLPKKNNFKINKISIFPISKSPIRCMRPDIINYLINEYYKLFDIEICLDKNSNLSNHIEKMINKNNITKIYPQNLKELCNKIDHIEFGIFIDSGPLHIAKILNKKGVLLSTSINKKVLLNNFNSISENINNYKSDYCKAPCGLIDIFNYKNKIGCYDSIRVSKDEIINLKNKNILQRGSLKKSYINFINNPVGCVKNIDYKSVFKAVNIILKKR